MKKILSILAAIALSGVMGATAFAQGYVVQGVVVDDLGPVVGAAVLEAGTTNGAVTDLDGNFSLRVSSPDATVEVSCIGYTTQTFKASQMPKTITLTGYLSTCSYTEKVYWFKDGFPYKLDYTYVDNGVKYPNHFTLIDAEIDSLEKLG